MNVSLILTVKNENENINLFFDSLLNQTKQPDEIIIVDAGSNDGTYEKLLNWASIFKNLLIIKVSGCNRSEGRNIAIKNAHYDIIAAADFGCSLHKRWIEEISAPIINGFADVTAGFYLNNDNRLIAKSNSFYTHPDLFEIKEDTFLPSTRSIAFKKKCWDAVNGFDEKFLLGEDTKFGFELRKKNFRIFFNKNAIVYWNSENSIIRMIKKLYNYSKWDGIGRFNSFFYLRKSIIVLFSILLFILSFFNIIFLHFFIILFLFFLLKTIIRIRKKKISTYPAIVFLTLKPLYDFIQTFGYLTGRCIGIRK